MDAACAMACSLFFALSMRLRRLPASPAVWPLDAANAREEATASGSFGDTRTHWRAARKAAGRSCAAMANRNARLAMRGSDVSRAKPYMSSAAWPHSEPCAEISATRTAGRLAGGRGQCQRGGLRMGMVRRHENPLASGTQGRRKIVPRHGELERTFGNARIGRFARQAVHEFGRLAELGALCRDLGNKQAVKNIGSQPHRWQFARPQKNLFRGIDLGRIANQQLRTRLGPRWVRLREGSDRHCHQNANNSFHRIHPGSLCPGTSFEWQNCMVICRDLGSLTAPRYA